MCNYITNGFSGNMLKNNSNLIRIENITEDDFNKQKNMAHSIVGHKQLAKHLKVKYNRENIHLEPGDTALLILNKAGRKHENEILLPEDCEYEYKLLTVIE